MVNKTYLNKAAKFFLICLIPPLEIMYLTFPTSINFADLPQ